MNFKLHPTIELKVNRKLLSFGFLKFMQQWTST